jgi:fibronectin-binding autotransporter adhesin
VSSAIAGIGDLYYSGFGTTVVTGAKTYTGETIISGGVVKFTSDAAFGQGGTLRLIGGTLEPTSDWETSRDIYAGSTVAIPSGLNASLNGRLLGPGMLVKEGAGTLTINGADEYQGDVLQRKGTLAINGLLGGGPASFGGDRVSNDPATILTGSGDWERNVAVRGTLAPGNGIGTIRARNVSFSTESSLALEIASATSFDQLQVRGTLDLSGRVKLDLTLGYDPADGIDSFLVIDNDGTDPITGVLPHLFSFNGNDLEELESFYLGNQEMKLSYLGGDGNDVVLYAVPEPGAFVLLLAGIPLLFRRRKQTARAVH